MALVSNSMTSQWKESYQRKILINRKHTKRTCLRQFQSRIGESRKEKALSFARGFPDVISS